MAFAERGHAEIRFIEYMDVPGATHWGRRRRWSRARTSCGRVQEAFGDIETLPPDGPAPASRYRLASGQVFGIIASTTTPFCSTCDRIRLTADGHLFSCLYATQGLDIRTPCAHGASDEDLVALLHDDVAAARAIAAPRPACLRRTGARSSPSRTCAGPPSSRCTRGAGRHGRAPGTGFRAHSPHHSPSTSPPLWNRQRCAVAARRSFRHVPFNFDEGSRVH